MKPFPRFLVAGLGVLLALPAGSRLDAQAVSRIERKVAFVQQHKDAFDILFVGSSRVFHGISPQIFDQVAAENGLHWRSFNLGMDEMGMAQSLDVIRKVMATHPTRLKYVVFELEPGTGMLARHPNGAGGPGGRPAPGGPGPLGPDGDGFFPMAQSMRPEIEAEYQQRLATEREHPTHPQPNETVKATLDNFAKELASANVQVVFLVAPSLKAAHGSGINAPSDSVLISFDDVVRYAPLHDEANRPDAEHLNARGAEIFSRLLAQEFVNAVHPPPR